jgi:hypothetical protein
MKILIKKDPEIKPLPNTPDTPVKTPEIRPKPEKITPYHPSLEISPNPVPEIKPGKNQ